MPGYILHLCEAKLIADQYMLRDTNINHSKQWLNNLYLGALLPDAVPKLQKDKTHFRDRMEQTPIISVPNLNYFSQFYTPHWTHPILCGYYAHLHLDQRFFSDYFKRYVTFYDFHGIETNLLSNAQTALIRKDNTTISLSEFFSNEWLYGDYTRLNYTMIEKYSLELPVMCDDFINPIQQAQDATISSVLKKLAEYLNRSPTNRTPLKVFDEDSLDTFLHNTAEEFLEVMNHESKYSER